MPERDRVEAGLAATRAGTPDFDRNDAATNAVDAIANVLLALDDTVGGGLSEHVLDHVLRTARTHYEAEVEHHEGCTCTRCVAPWDVPDA